MSQPVPVPAGAPLKDPVGEARRLVDAAANKGLTVRVLGSVAVYLQAPAAGPLFARPMKDIDIATKQGRRAAATELLITAGYVPDEMFNALHGARRLLFYDEVNARKLDVFIGEFSMCHVIPIADRLDRDPLTIPLAELLLTKLQIVELTETDQRDIYNLCYDHQVSSGDGSGIEGDFIADVCARDWGLWRTSKATVERCKSNLAGYGLDGPTAAMIRERLDVLWARIDEAPKSAKWKLRSRVGDRMRWYDEPEESTN
ncbi:MAG: nucleotidyltransferase family protein [Candidatus Dormibacteraeota bacterium]|nr:nucleotidyltransferase family protein [Candidatus Dormibacteraeota bacterium]